MSYFSEPKIMLFSIAAGGHYSNYVHCLIDYWCKNKITGKLYILTSPEFLDRHFENIKISTHCEQYNVKFVSITKHEYSEVLSCKRPISIALAEWKLLRKYTQHLEIDHCLMMFVDHFQLLLVLGFSLSCTFSGIYFRPAFHYKYFDKHVYRHQDFLRQWRQKLLIFQALKNPGLRYLFCLDPFVIKYFKKSQSHSKILFLPDPVKNFKDNGFTVKEFKAKLKISEERCVFLLFGQVDKRKGIYQLLDAMRSLPKFLCEKVCLLLVGPVSFPDQQRIEALLQGLSDLLPVQIIVRNEFIPESEIQAYFQVADVILAPYQRHIGMSGILLLAAAARKPVLSSSYGLMGEITQRYELGLTVDSTNPLSITKALIRFLTEPPKKFCDLSKMQRLVEQHEADKFAQTIFSHICSLYVN